VRDCSYCIQKSAYWFWLTASVFLKGKSPSACCEHSAKIQFVAFGVQFHHPSNLQEQGQIVLLVLYILYWSGCVCVKLYLSSGGPYVAKVHWSRSRILNRIGVESPVQIQCTDKPQTNDEPPSAAFDEAASAAWTAATHFSPCCSTICW